MKRASIALTALVLLSLTACAGTPETAPSEPTVSGQSVMEEAVTPDPTPTVEPAPTVTPGVVEYTPEPEPELKFDGPEQEYIYTAQDYLNGWGYWDFTNDQVLSAGLYACENPDPNLIVIEGINEGHNADVVEIAHTTLCP